MIRGRPKRPTGSSPKDIFDQWVWDTLCTDLQFGNSPTVQVNRNSRGITFTAAPPGGQGGSLIQCVITTLFTEGPNAPYDYMGVTAYDAVSDSLSGPEFVCLKCIGGQCPATEVIDGNQINYTYTDDNTRTATQASNPSETHKMHGRYMTYPVEAPGLPEQATIYVTRIQNGPIMNADAEDPINDGVPIYYLEVQPSRNWALAAS